MFSEHELKIPELKISELMPNYKITDRSIINMRLKGGISEDLLDKLEAMKDETYIGEEEFLLNLKKTIGKEQTDKTKSEILTYAKSYHLRDYVLFGACFSLIIIILFYVIIYIFYLKFIKRKTY